MELAPAILIIIICSLGAGFIICLWISDIFESKKKKSDIKPVGELIIQESDQTCFIAINEDVADKIPNMKQVTLDVKVRK